MRKLIAIALFFISGCLYVSAQCDSLFTSTIYNKELSIYIVIDAVNKNVTIPGQEFMGEMVGYLGDSKDFRKWLILDSEPMEKNSLKLQITNDEGSEDLEAKLTCNNDSTYTLKQLSGSTLKIARNRKWQKLPKTLTFTKRSRNK
jgi:hypothetical protein